MFRKLLISLALLFGAFGTISAAAVTPASAVCYQSGVQTYLIQSNHGAASMATACNGSTLSDRLRVVYRCQLENWNHYGQWVYGTYNPSQGVCPGSQIVTLYWSQAG